MEAEELHTRKWVSEVVVGLNLCPFAAREVKRESILYSILRDADEEAVMHAMMQVMEQMDHSEDVETALIILPDAFGDFMEYLDLVYLSEELIAEQEYEGIYQVAGFHPEYQFEGTSIDDPANYTNRSPYPMLHIIREESIERVLENVADPDSIPERNVKLLREKGLIYIQALRNACMKSE